MIYKDFKMSRGENAKWTFFMFVLFTTFSSCGNCTENKTNITLTDTVLTTEKTEKEFYTVKKLFVVGDFDGDGITDTLFEHNHSNLTGTEIDSFLRTDDWKPFFDWFYAQEPDLRLTFNKKGRDTLHLGENLGLFCLINIGDNNSDGKDEIALVTNLCDWSNLNSCLIYTLCNNKWTLIKEFNIHESSFYYAAGEEQPVFNEIEGYLEKRNGEWFYLDFFEVWDTEEEVGQMKPLKIEKCK